MKIEIDTIALAVVISVFALYLWVTIPSPIAFGDEGYYSAQARYIVDNKLWTSYDQLYSTNLYKIKFTKLPMFYITLSSLWFIGGEFLIKISSPLFAALGALVIFLFFKNRGDNNGGIVGAIAYLMTPALVTYAVLFYVDTLLTLFMLLSFYFANLSINNDNRFQALLASVFGALATLTKTTGIITLPIVLAYFIITKKSQSFKFLPLLVIPFLLITIPYGIRNVISYDSPCLLYIPYGRSLCEAEILSDHTDPNLQFAGRTAEVGTEVTLFQQGIHNFIRFAFGWSIPILFLLGSFVFFREKKEFKILVGLWLVAFIAIMLMFTERAEDTARFIVPGTAAVAIVVGNFVSQAYERLYNKGKYLAAIFVILILISLLFYGWEKISIMTKVKQFVPAFFDGCEWIKDNTPTDSLILSLYGHPTAYNCNRALQWEVPDKSEILLSNNDRSYERLKSHGFDYIMVQHFAVSATPYGQTYPICFVQYLDSSSKYEKVYDNRMTFGEGGISVYKVL